MNIIIAKYSLVYDDFYIGEPFEIKKETEKCYWSGITKSGAGVGTRILKEEVGKVRHLDKTSYPYLEVAMIDATEQEIKEKLAEWFRKKADFILK